MQRLSSRDSGKPRLPVKVLQFGEGNFLRAFVDYMLDIANEQGKFGGSIILVKPIPYGSLQAFHEQDCRYTVLLRGLEDGQRVEKTRLITSVADAVDAYTEYEKYAAYARLDSLRFIVSNTTEAGIVLDDSDRFALTPPNTYPGKLTKFLYERALAFDYASDKGLIILPVELIDDNGIVLERCVKALAEHWVLGGKFLQWLDDACVFTSTLVDRIVTGYPRDEAEALWQKIGYEDRLLVTAEPFGLWVIESRKDIHTEMPLPECGLPVLFTDNQKPYKQRKVRILNGAHTSFVPAAFLCGHNSVLEAMDDPLIKSFMQHTLYDEVIPTLDLPLDDLLNFAKAVTSRFENPYIKHSLLSICLNSVSKWRARCLPSLLGYYERKGALPPRLTFSLAALMALYQNGTLADGTLVCTRDGEPYTLRDDEAVLAFFAENTLLPAQEQVSAFLSRADFFGQDLTRIPGLSAAVTASFAAIQRNGMRAAMETEFRK
ncbi:MAG: tagaturonate reductase [Eubacteriales bacterium]|nr:tagaturonate reductase [Eubacteriales bacterium]